MTPITFAKAQIQHPDLVEKVLEKLAQAKPDVVPEAVSWFSVACYDDPEELLDEAAIADVMLTGKMPCRIGICGKVDGHFGCFCHTKMIERERLMARPLQ